MKLSSLCRKIFVRSRFSNSYRRLSVTENHAESVHIGRGSMTFYIGEEDDAGHEVPVKYLSCPPLVEELRKLSQGGELRVMIDGPIKFACTPNRSERILKIAKKF